MVNGKRTNRQKGKRRQVVNGIVVGLNTPDMPPEWTCNNLSEQGGCLCISRCTITEEYADCCGCQRCCECGM